MKSPSIGLLAACFVAALFIAPPVFAADKKKKSPPEEESRKNVFEQLQEELQRRTKPTPAPVQRSQESATAVRVRVANLTGRPVELIWVNPTGGQRSYGQVPSQIPGDEPFVMDTFVGHVWLFKSGGRVLQTYTATGSRRQIVTLGGGRGADGQRPPASVEEPRPAPNQPPVTTGKGSVPAPKGDKAPAGTAEFLKVHNDARARVGVAPLRWSETLARYAQEWADLLASTGTFRHRDPSSASYGENLFGGSEGYGPADAARNWLEERAAYRGGPVTPQNFGSVGHYTQMVWSETTEVGYGMARGRNGMVIVVGNYSPRGNRSGQKPY